jgi:hypothetical protein
MADMDVFNSVEAYSKGMAYFSSPLFVYSQAGNEATIAAAPR